MKTPRKQVVITMGDPAGSGPESVIFSLRKVISQKPLRATSYVVIGAKKILSKIPGAGAVLRAVELIDLDNVDLKEWQWGAIDRSSGKAAREYIDTALALLKHDHRVSLVTAPVSKEAIGKTGIVFHGHTEYLAEMTKTRDVIMLFKGRRLILSLITRHMPLARVSGELSDRALIKKTFALTYGACKRLFGFRSPRIGICAFNPHAGIDTFMRSEEKALARVRDSLPGKKNFQGPFPPDSIFAKALKRQLDAVVCCYHDQAMIPFKLLDFDNGVNITYGLPFLRVSPVYGTAKDIAGTGTLNYSSMVEAIRFASLHTDDHGFRPHG